MVRTAGVWFGEETQAAAELGHARQVIFFHGCAGPELTSRSRPRPLVMVLEHLGYEVPGSQAHAAALALQSNGLYDDARKYVSD